MDILYEILGLFLEIGILVVGCVLLNWILSYFPGLKEIFFIKDEDEEGRM